MEERKNAMRRSSWQRPVLAIGFPSIVFLVTLAILLSPYRASWRWTHEPFHALILSGGAFSVICSALFFMATQQIESPEPGSIRIITALLGMGILDGFHAGHPENLSLWLHSLATLVGGLTLALLVLPDSESARVKLRIAPCLMAAFCLFSGIVSMLFADRIAMMQTDGQLVPAAQLLNIVGGIGFMTAWWHFLRRENNTSHWQRFLPANGSLFFAFAAFLSPLASPWDGIWWLWHMLTFFSYLIFCYFFLRSCRGEIKILLKTSKELEKSGKQFSTFIENLPAAATVKDTAGRFVWVNKRFEEIFGLEKKDIVGKSAKDILPYIKKMKLIDSLGSAEQKLKTEYEEDISIKNKVRTFSTARFPLTFNEKEICGVGYVQTDITERKELEYQVRLDQKIIENAKEAIIVTDTEAVILTVNKAYTEITGYMRQEVVGKNPRVGQSGHHDQSFYKKMWGQLLNTGIWSGEIWDRRKNGEIYQKKLTINAIRDTTGATINYVGIFTDVTREKKVARQLKDLLFYDPLTNLPNRTLFEELLTQALLNSQSHDIPLVLLYIDLDRFKDVNDSLGYKAGDDLLVQVAQRIRSGVRKTDTVSRLCGDEFTVILSEVKLKEAVGSIAQHLLHLLRQPFHFSGEEIFIDASIGISVYPEDGRDTETIIKNADMAMHFAKKKEYEDYQYFRIQMNENLVHRTTLEKRLRRALECEEFVLYYQPKYSFLTERIVGMESLIRWDHPEKGIISPAEFIPIAEESNLILALGEWGLKVGCRQVKAWEKEGLGLYPIAVNLSSKQFQDKKLLALLVEVLDETGLYPSFLELEITESIVMERPDEAAELLRQIRQLGVRIAIDDFGTGYSSLAYLQKFPINTLKIDQTFVSEIAQNDGESIIVDSILSMAENLNLKVVAEGIETKNQLEFFKKRKCHEAQGYYFSRPLATEKFAEKLREMIQSGSEQSDV